jgi:hypothetical protein
MMDDTSPRLRLVWVACVIAAPLIAFADAVARRLAEPDGPLGWMELPDYFGLFALIACAGLMFMALVLGISLRRREGHYDG